MDDDSGESMEPMEEVPLVGESTGEIRPSAWERSQKLIPETVCGFVLVFYGNHSLKMHRFYRAMHSIARY